MTTRSLAFAFDAEGWEPPSPPDVDVCGVGQGAKCCKFLMAGPDGFVCARYTELHPVLVDRQMVSQFVPTEPDCQAERAEL